MNWTEQPADVAPLRLTDFLRTVTVIDAMLLVSRLRQSSVVGLGAACREGIRAHLATRRTELGGLLIGRAYLGGSDIPQSWAPLITIDRFVPSDTCRTTSVSLAMDTEVWDRARAALAAEDGMVVGWYHSHPNLGAFFSGTDRATHHAFFNQPYSVGLVVDPIRDEEAWFVGPDSTPLGAQCIVPLTASAGSSECPAVVSPGARRTH